MQQAQRRTGIDGFLCSKDATISISDDLLESTDEEGA
jgi:hypothetical protein